MSKTEKELINEVEQYIDTEYDTPHLESFDMQVGGFVPNDYHLTRRVVYDEVMDWDSYVNPEHDKLHEQLSSRIVPAKMIMTSTPTLAELQERMDIMCYLPTTHKKVDTIAVPSGYKASRELTNLPIDFVVDKYLPKSELKYPTGYKDGNKLGKRKREMKVIKVYAFQRDILKSLDVPYDGRIIKKSWKRR